MKRMPTKRQLTKEWQMNKAPEGWMAASRERQGLPRGIALAPEDSGAT